ncbi:MFS transporter [Bacillus sp. FJAT-42376]|uniref:MFS transporter n=1 Tax=Bacillus sp. FJAT-42376 TaxID=2014076 RepID=UPI000F4F2614|nr:MFS transporter [Bacillus sp. FJAT-42376]AZB41674.1 MFS transporter [Bacillus sp. FJAT-42376]
MNKIRFAILISIVTVSGFSQGMLLPVIAILFEQQGYPSSLNGLHATGLYIGVLLASPFMEKPLQKLGYKKMIIIGGFLVMASLFAFPVLQSFWIWFVLRLLVGIGDHMLHFSTQTWITSISSDQNRGKNISLYGLCFGLGFAAGPVLTSLAAVNPNLPFIISGSVSLLIWGLAFILRNDFPEQEVSGPAGSTARFKEAWKLSWIAFLPPFVYGFLESSLNGNYPVYALRQGFSPENVAILLPAFAVGGIIFQLPLGILSDKFGRKLIIPIVLFLGFLSFLAASFTHSFILLLICFFLAGMVLGSTFSLGLTYMADLLPKHLLPAGNLLCGICFSVGSISGPVIGGLYMEYMPGSSFFHIVAFLLLSVLAVFMLKGRKQEKTVACKQ